MTFDDLARESGVNRGMIVGIVHGRRNAGVASIFELAQALGVSASELIRDAEADTSN